MRLCGRLCSESREKSADEETSKRHTNKSKHASRTQAKKQASKANTTASAFSSRCAPRFDGRVPVSPSPSSEQFARQPAGPSGFSTCCRDSRFGSRSEVSCQHLATSCSRSVLHQLVFSSSSRVTAAHGAACRVQHPPTRREGACRWPWPQRVREALGSGIRQPVLHHVTKGARCPP